VLGAWILDFALLLRDGVQNDTENADENKATTARPLTLSALRSARKLSIHVARSAFLKVPKLLTTFYSPDGWVRHILISEFGSGY
jgi:hypothetical protein